MRTTAILLLTIPSNLAMSLLIYDDLFQLVGLDFLKFLIIGLMIHFSMKIHFKLSHKEMYKDLKDTDLVLFYIPALITISIYSMIITRLIIKIITLIA